MKEDKLTLNGGEMKDAVICLRDKLEISIEGACIEDIEIDKGAKCNGKLKKMGEISSLKGLPNGEYKIEKLIFESAKLHSFQATINEADLKLRISLINSSIQRLEESLALGADPILACIWPKLWR